MLQDAVLNADGAPPTAADTSSSVPLRVRRKQNKYPILFLTQGISENYSELMDIRCQTTQIAISFAQSENILVRCETFF